MLKIECYVPESHLEQVKQALFSAGAGQLGDYRACCWSVSGQGQFEPQVVANLLSERLIK